MSKATKRKHVTKEVLDEFALPEGDRQIVKVCASRGNNLHEVETPNGETFLVSMPTKFRKNVWIKRGDYVMVKPIEEGDKVKAEISHILYREQMKYIKDEGLWPSKFEAPKAETGGESMIPSDMLPPSGSEDEEDYLSDNGLQFSNPNRNVCLKQDSEESEESSDEDD